MLLWKNTNTYYCYISASIVLILNIPINNFAAMLGRETSTKAADKMSCTRTLHSDSVGDEPLIPNQNALTTEPLHSAISALCQVLHEVEATHKKNYLCYEQYFCARNYKLMLKYKETYHLSLRFTRLS